MVLRWTVNEREERRGLSEEDSGQAADFCFKIYRRESFSVGQETEGRMVGLEIAFAVIRNSMSREPSRFIKRLSENVVCRKAFVLFIYTKTSQNVSVESRSRVASGCPPLLGADNKKRSFVEAHDLLRKVFTFKTLPVESKHTRFPCERLVSLNISPLSKSNVDLIAMSMLIVHWYQCNSPWQKIHKKKGTSTFKTLRDGPHYRLRTNFQVVW